MPITIKTKQNKNLLLVGLTITIGLSIVVLYFTKAPQQMTNSVPLIPRTTNPIPTIRPEWLTYNNSSKGFKISYPPNWEVTEKGEKYLVVGLTSPETKKLFKSNKIYYTHDITIDFFATIGDEPENKANVLNARTVEEFVERNPFIKKIGAIEVGRTVSTEILWGGNMESYVILVPKYDHLYRIDFPGVQTKEAVTSTEKEILNSFQFTN